MPETGQRDDRALVPVVRLIACYRLLCACFIYFSVETGLFDSSSFYDKDWYQASALVYTVIAVAFLLGVLLWPRHPYYQYLLHLGADLIVLGLIFYFSGGAANDHSILPIISASFSIAVLPPLPALGVVATCLVILLATEATLALFSTWQASVASMGIDGLVTMGLLPLLFWLNTRLQRAEKSGRHARIDYQQLAEVNWDIINYMSTGCLIVDRGGTIVHINPSACALFATEWERCVGQRLSDFSEQLYSLYQQEGLTGIFEARPINLVGLGSRVLPHFFHLDRDLRTVILLDNLHEEIARIQQSRLATFGKMIHALMHEIANPLATIEQALGSVDGDGDGGKEGAQPRPQQRRDEFLPLFRRQVRRIVDIVRGTRNLLPNRKIEQERIDLLAHIRAVFDDMELERRGEDGAAPFRSQIDADSLEKLSVRFDPTHLSQILSNLVRNSIDHSKVDPGNLLIQLRGRRSGPFVELEYWDNGVGIEGEARQSIYKSFYSSDQERAGLGLHICNELCQLNGAALEYISLAVPARFRLSLPAAD